MESYEIFIPKSFDGDYKNILELFQELSRIYGTIQSGDELVFVFEKTRWMNAEMTTFLAMIFDHAVRNEIKVFAKLDSMSLKTKEILLKNGFLTNFGILEEVEDIHDTTIRFFKAKTNKQEKIDQYIHNELFRSISNKTSPEFLNEIYENLWEIIHNVIDHSKSDYLYMCGQHYPRKPRGSMNGKVSFAISDIGIGLLENIKNKTNIVTDLDAFTWAFKEGTTTKDSADGGLGLFEIKEKLKNKGSILAISNQGYYRIAKNGKEFFNPFPFNISGTLVVITLFLDDCMKNYEENDTIEKEEISVEDDFLELF